jgi:hypothetical protein
MYHNPVWNHLESISAICLTIGMCEEKHIRNFITALFIWPMKDVILYFSINLDFRSYLIKHFKDLLVNSTGLKEGKGRKLIL